MGDISKRRSCMYDIVTMNSEMENIVKDALERRSRTHLARSFILRSQCGAMLWLPRRSPTTFSTTEVGREAADGHPAPNAPDLSGIPAQTVTSSTTGLKRVDFPVKTGSFPRISQTISDFG